MKIKTVPFLSVTRSLFIVVILTLLLGKTVNTLKIRHSILKAAATKTPVITDSQSSSPPSVAASVAGGVGSCTKTSCPPGAQNKPVVSSILDSHPRPTTSTVIGSLADNTAQLVGGSRGELGFDAISVLHRQLDDDANGNIDVSESDEFLRDELQYENGYERQKTFHGNDKHISVDELWNSWKLSEVHNWTVEQTVQWLVDQVELPQYSQVFQDHKVDGAMLPSMAVPNMHYLTQVLGIKDPRHKQKLALKAMDVVLFGPPRHHNFIKDGLLVTLLVIAIGGCWFAFVNHKRSQTHMKKMMHDMESLQHAEEALEMLQHELDKARQENLQHKIREREDGSTYLRSGRDSSQPRSFGGGASGSSGGSSPDEEELSKRQETEEELRRTKEQLARMEHALKSRAWAPPAALQHWLQMTYELEQRHYNCKKAAAEMQLASAKEGCEKIRKRRSSFLGTFRIAHGSVIDDVDTRILQARAALSEVTKDLQERLHRWRQVELLCGFPIVMNAGLLQLEAILRGTSVANGSALTSALGLRSARGNMSRSCSEGTLLEDEVAGASNSTKTSATNLPSFGNASAVQQLVHGSAALFLASVPPACLKCGNHQGNHQGRATGGEYCVGDMSSRRGSIISMGTSATSGVTAPILTNVEFTYSNGSVISMPQQGFSNLACNTDQWSSLERTPGSMGSTRIGSSTSLSSESKVGHLISGSKHLHQLEEEDFETDDEIDNGELDDCLEDNSNKVNAAATTNGRASSAPPEEVNRPVFTLGNEGIGDHNSDHHSSSGSILLEKRSRMLKTQSLDQTPSSTQIPLSQHSPYYHQQQQQQSSSSSTSSTASPSICPEPAVVTLTSAGSSQADLLSEQSLQQQQPVISHVMATLPVSGRRKKSSNLISTFRQSLSTNPPPTLEEENSTDSASVDDSDSKKEKKKVSILSRLKKKSKTP